MNIQVKIMLPSVRPDIQNQVYLPSKPLLFLSINVGHLPQVHVQRRLMLLSPAQPQIAVPSSEIGIVPLAAVMPPVDGSTSPYMHPTIVTQVMEITEHVHTATSGFRTHLAHFM